MSKHTPGPWIVCLSHGAARDFGRLYHVTTDPAAHTYQAYGCIADVSGPGELFGTTDPEAAEANARLIAAAPALLEALRECVQVYEAHRDAQPTGHLWPDPNHIFHARDAIEKATGKSA